MPLVKSSPHYTLVDVFGGLGIVAFGNVEEAGLSRNIDICPGFGGGAIGPPNFSSSLSLSITT